jgi:predicted AlkP superfamily pyrophosphatase or phosphodiesterase
MIDAVDTGLNDFFTFLDRNVDGGLSNVWVALTGDHGVSPIAVDAARLGMPSAFVDMPKVVDSLEAALNRRFSPGKSVKYILRAELPYIELDPRVFAELKIDENAAESAVADMLPAAFQAAVPPQSSEVSQQRLPEPPVLRHVYTRTQMAAGNLPATDEGRRILHSYSPNGGWYVMLTPGMYNLPIKAGTTHFSPYSYDRHVPLAFFGAPFIPGTYHDLVAPVDIASTFASLLRVNRPTAAVGRVLTMAIRSEHEVTATPVRKPSTR